MSKPNPLNMSLLLGLAFVAFGTSDVYCANWPHRTAYGAYSNSSSSHVQVVTGSAIYQGLTVA